MKTSQMCQICEKVKHVNFFDMTLTGINRGPVYSIVCKKCEAERKDVKGNMKAHKDWADLTVKPEIATAVEKVQG